MQCLVDDGVEPLGWRHGCTDADGRSLAGWMVACAPNGAADLARLDELHAPHDATNLACESVTGHRAPPNSFEVACDCVQSLSF